MSWSVSFFVFAFLSLMQLQLVLFWHKLLDILPYFLYSTKPYKMFLLLPKQRPSQQSIIF